MRVLGIDPGSQITGVAILERGASGKSDDMKVVFSESLRLPKGALPQRLGAIYQRLEELIKQYQPSQIALEKVFLAKNPQAALTLGHARGAAMLAGVNAGLDVFEYSATEIKKTVVGKGRADKAQVQHMVKALLQLNDVPEEDEADAIACALCHFYISASPIAAALSASNGKGSSSKLSKKSLSGYPQSVIARMKIQ